MQSMIQLQKQCHHCFIRLQIITSLLHYFKQAQYAYCTFNHQFRLTYKQKQTSCIALRKLHVNGKKNLARAKYVYNVTIISSTRLICNLFIKFVNASFSCLLYIQSLFQADLQAEREKLQSTEKTARQREKELKVCQSVTII